jgi:hypothetical protein
MTSPSPLERLTGPGNVLAKEAPDAKEFDGPGCQRFYLTDGRDRLGTRSQQCSLNTVRLNTERLKPGRQRRRLEAQKRCGAAVAVDAPAGVPQRGEKV